MKKLILFFTIALAFAISAPVYADNRAETKGTCHFAPDPADDDNEVYGSVCKNSIETYDAGDGQGRLAYTEVWAHKDYTVIDGAFPKSIGPANKATRGSDADPDQYNVWTGPLGDETPYTLTENTNCASVTHNYNNGDNYTVYNSDDYNVEYWWTSSPVGEYANLGIMMRLNIHMVCRGGVPQQ